MQRHHAKLLVQFAECCEFLMTNDVSNMHDACMPPTTKLILAFFYSAVDLEAAALHQTYTSEQLEFRTSHSWQLLGNVFSGKLNLEEESTHICYDIQVTMKAKIVI
jgi:hypothetical protein